MNVASTNSLKVNLKSGAEVCGYAVDASSFIVSETDPLEKTLKVISKTIVLSSFIKASEAGTLIANQFKDTISLLETISFFRNLQTIIRPNKDGVFFLQDPANSWQKRTARISLLAHNVLKLFVAAKKWKLIELAIAAKYLIGRLPFFTLVTDGLYGAYNFFSAWDNLKVLINCRKASSLVEKKIVKLQGRLNAIANKDQTPADGTPAQDISSKLSKWKFNKHTLQLNRNKALMAFCSTAAKAAAVALTLFFVAINVWTAPAAIILATSLSLIGDSFGITRILYDKFPPKYSPISS